MAEQAKPKRGRPRKAKPKDVMDVQVRHMPAELWQEVKVQAIQERRELYLVVQDALREYLERKRREAFEASGPVYE